MPSSVLEQTVLNSLPKVGASLVFGYGSKVVGQKGRQSAQDQVDVILVVDNPLEWHGENFNLNRQHYSFVKYLPNSIEKVVKIQELYGSRIYFNPFVRLGNITVKYGVIKTAHLIEDLMAWDKLYVSGRLHKPVEFIINTCDKNELLRNSMRFNKESALRAAMLQLPEQFDTMSLYKVIAGLSYHGDFRMWFGEDKNKIQNIVTAQRELFDQLYLPIIKLNQNFKESVQFSESKQLLTQDLSARVVLKNLEALPSNVIRSICKSQRTNVRTIESDRILASVARSANCDKIVAHAISMIVRRSSLSQSVKGIFTAGLVKSLRYSQRKLIKSLYSRVSLSSS